MNKQPKPELVKPQPQRVIATPIDEPQTQATANRELTKKILFAVLEHFATPAQKEHLAKVKNEIDSL